MNRPTEKEIILEISSSIERDLEKLKLLPNLKNFHRFLNTLSYQEKYEIINSLNQSLIYLLLQKKFIKKCLWMIYDIYNNHGFLIEVGFNKFMNLEKQIEKEHLWFKIKKSFAIVFLNDDLEENLSKIKLEISQIKNQASKSLDTEVYDKEIKKLKKATTGCSK